MHVTYPTCAALMMLTIGCLSSCVGNSRMEESASRESFFDDKYIYALSTGSFGIPNGTISLDWTVLNDSPVAQQIRVVVYNVNFDPKQAVSGPTETVIQPYSETHNANGVENVFHVWGNYEVVVETMDARVLPTVECWSSRVVTVIPGTRISPRDFIDLKHGMELKD